MRVAITGASGLLGWHLRCLLHGESGFEVVSCVRADFGELDRLAATLEGVDAVVHFAGMNRGDSAEIERTNLALARQVVGAIERRGGRPHVIYASTTHVTRDSPYGRSKREAGEVFEAWSARAGANYTCLVLPHAYGESGRPFYNSVVSTFCHQLAAGQSPTVLDEGDLELLHAQDVAKLVVDALRNAQVGEVWPRGIPLKVTQLRDRLQALAASYRAHLIPDLRDPLDLRLFNTYRSYLMPAGYPVTLPLKDDVRGALFEAVRSLSGGQCFLSTTRPGFTRGNHYHRRKVERFLVISGSATICVRRLFDTRIHEFAVSGDSPAYVDMPTFNTHCITNVGSKDLVTLFWTHEIYDPSDSDTYPERVRA